MSGSETTGQVELTRSTAPNAATPPTSVGISLPLLNVPKSTTPIQKDQLYRSGVKKTRIDCSMSMDSSNEKAQTKV